MEQAASHTSIRAQLRRHASSSRGKQTWRLQAGDRQSGERSPLLDHLSRPFTSERTWSEWFKHVLHTTYQVLISNPVNLLLVFIPIGIIAGAVKWNPTATFILNFLAIIPLASLLSFATEELSAKLGQTLGGLLNATFGNAVELIVSIVALKNGEIRIVQSSMLGSILSNTLLVLGCCFLAGGIAESEQCFDSTVASTMASLMAVSSASLIIPATLAGVMGESQSPKSPENRANRILVLSHATAIILLILYILYLIFQLKSHSYLFDKDDVDDKDNVEEQDGSANHAEQGQANHNDDNRNKPQPTEPQILSPPAAGVALVIITVAVAVCAEFLVDSIDSIVETAHISKTFIGLILLPIVGNAAEHVTAVVVAYKSKMNLAIGVAIGSSMQIALLVTPFLVILGWIINQPMTLRFELFETVVFFLSVLITNYLISDGKSNYLEGAMLIGLYTIIAVAFYVYPDAPGSL